MSFVNIHFFVIMLTVIVNGISGSIQDVSNECENNETVSYYLSTGFGKSDAAALMIAIDKEFSCLLVFYVQPKSFVNMVLEFPDLGQNDSVCITEENSVVMVREFHGQNKCKIITGDDIYSKVRKQYILTEIESEGNLSTVKITATALRPINSSTCTDGQIHCAINEEYFCVSPALRCDGNKNCGDYLFFDETDCGSQPLPPVTIIFSIAMTLATIWIITSILKNLFPKRGRTFIYRVDEPVSPYDAQYSNLQIEVFVNAVFPSESSRSKNISGDKQSTLKKVTF